ncbi:hypothetical protein ACR79M_13925 [Sphingobacterium spiritivorum]|nr:MULTISPECIES: hypothetical protein [Sphingobacterium]QQT27191.1 hypothetical protein I6J02_04840 [Sphingobacterium spiritivorum]
MISKKNNPKRRYSHSPTIMTSDFVTIARTGRHLLRLGIVMSSKPPSDLFL